MPYKHTDSNTCSDIGLIATGADLSQLMADAAIGLIAVTAEPDELVEKQAIDIILTADNLEDLFYSWLSEIIYFKDARNFLTCRCDIEVSTAPPYELTGQIYGDIVDRSRHTLKVDVKAVTYYRLRIEKKNDHWEAEAVLDL
jgi:SHS2 domain-containing protein